MAKLLRSSAGTSPACQSWQWKISVRNRMRATASAARAEHGKADVVVGIIHARFAVEAFSVEQRRAIHQVERKLGRRLVDGDVGSGPGPRYTGRMPS